ncbi:DUF3891 family protein [Mesonia aquimarina]|uniref:DUF3891 family protein n=1 Tax=Mesonia aquimarina TaxID=1504967 RepID=UPI000EF58170|nr:DUF3891 family protein [Mesonia aquimarina]
MIVNKKKNGYALIYHTAHGFLASKIAKELNFSVRTQYWEELVLAICAHDDQQLNFAEKKYLSKNGIPLDFTESSDTVWQILKRMKRIFHLVYPKSLYSALLVVYHFNFLYGHLRKKSKLIQDFFLQQKKVEQEVLRIYSLTSEEVKSAYDILRFCDRLSLILCKNEIPTGHRKLEINTSILDKTYYIFKNKKNQITVEPWLFKENKISLSVEQRLVNIATFSNEDSFKSALKQTQPHLVSYSLHQS